MRIQNGKMLTMDGQNYENGYLDFENGVITALGDMRNAPAASGEVFDAKGGYILPGLIDAHSHIGITEEGVRWEGEDCNENTTPTTPSLSVVDGFYPFDTAIPKARQAGVTTAEVCPGSTNVIGGQTAVIKLCQAANVEDMILKSQNAIKCAMGENPKNYFGEKKGVSPMTRMATAAILRNTLTRAQRYMAKKESGDKDLFDPDMEALLPLLRGEIPAHIHAHRCDDILTALRIAREFGLRCSTIHTTGGARIVEAIAASGEMPIIGPCIGPASKPETVGGSLEMTVALHKAGVEFALTTDHDVTPLWLLPHFAAITVREGLDEETAFRSITINAARIAGVEDRIGSLRVGKDADIVVYTGHPFHYLTKTAAVFINGRRQPLV